MPIALSKAGSLEFTAQLQAAPLKNLLWLSTACIALEKDPVSPKALVVRPPLPWEGMFQLEELATEQTRWL